MLVRLGRLLRVAGRDLMVLWFACRHPATPRPIKVAALLLVLYVFSPLDVLPDWLAVLGWVDDITLLTLAVPALLGRVPPSVLEQARAAAAGWTAPWRRGSTASTSRNRSTGENGQRFRFFG